MNVDESTAMSSRPVIAQEPRAKRPFDFALALLGLILSFPIWALVALAILLDDGLPIFYFQERVGGSGRGFMIWKFRSMTKDAEGDSGPIAATADDPRMTRVGKVIRKMGLDELPQLVNIVRGDMSFVGPRADRPWEFEQSDRDLRHGINETSGQIGGSASGPTFDELIPDYHMRLRVRPGLTGLAQVYGRYNTPRRRKLTLDMLYIENMSWWLDVRLILVSFWISASGKWESRQRKF